MRRLFIFRFFFKQVKLASLDASHRHECLARTGELKHHVKELEKQVLVRLIKVVFLFSFIQFSTMTTFRLQRFLHGATEPATVDVFLSCFFFVFFLQLEKLKPLISLVDNMVKLGSMSPQKQRRAPERVPEASTAVKRNLTPLLHQQQHEPMAGQHRATYHSPTYTNLQLRSDTLMFHSTPSRLAHGWEEAHIAQLESKHHQLGQLEKFVREEGAAIERLTRNQHVLRLAIRAVRQQTNGALQRCDYPEVDRCREQQMFLERELGHIHSLLALSSKRLEDAAVEIGRIERDISALHQELHRAGSGRTSAAAAPAGSHSSNRAGREMAWLEAELGRVQQHVSQLQTKRLELSSQVGRLTCAEFLLDADDAAAAHWSETPKRKPLATW